MLTPRNERQPALARLALLGIAAVAGARSAGAHEGPPFPILMDQPAAGYQVSVWADPDIGDARFFIIVETPGGGTPHPAPRVSMWTEPASGRLDRVVYETALEPLRNQMQFAAQPHFDQRDMWLVGFRLTSPAGESAEITTEIESTPPGYGAWDLAIYLFPFVLLAGFWALALLRRSRMVRREAPAPDCTLARQHSGVHHGR